MGFWGSGIALPRTLVSGGALGIDKARLFDGSILALSSKCKCLSNIFEICRCLNNLISHLFKVDNLV